MQHKTEEKWFETWFDSPYYHILYQNRNNDEAKLFIDNLISFLHPKIEDNFLDLACGKGRHALQISEKGYHTLGVDLSSNSIEFAKQFESPQLHFAVHDMRHVIQGESFDFILNLFTSFGYFDDEKDNITMLNSIHRMLNDKGIFVLDFFNSYKVIDCMQPTYEMELSNIHFHISKKMINKKIIKTIRFQDGGKDYHFEEKVNAFSDTDILSMLEETGFRILHTFGNYDLEPFEKSTADRFIVIASKA